MRLTDLAQGGPEHFEANKAVIYAAEKAAAEKAAAAAAAAAVKPEEGAS